MSVWARKIVIMKKSNAWKKTEWAGLICIFFILMVLIHMLWNSGADGEMADIRSVSSGWYQVVDGKEEALDLPAMVKADQDGKIMLYNNTLTPEDKNKVLSIRLKSYIAATLDTVFVSTIVYAIIRKDINKKLENDMN